MAHPQQLLEFCHPYVVAEVVRRLPAFCRTFGWESSIFLCPRSGEQNVEWVRRLPL